MAKFEKRRQLQKRRSPAAKALASDEFKPKRIAGKKYSRKGLKAPTIDPTLGVDENDEPLGGDWYDGFSTEF